MVLTENRVLRTILRPRVNKLTSESLLSRVFFRPLCRTTSPLRPIGKRGFTLIEILIVLALISMIMSVGMPAIRTVTQQQLSSTARRFIGLVKTIRNDAILLSTVHRLVINLEDQTWWVESQRKFELLDDTPLEDRGGGKDTPESNFTIATKFSKEPKPISAGAKFQGVLTERDGLINGGVVYIHFFPNGFTEQSIIYLARPGDDETVQYSLIIRPTGGRLNIVNGFTNEF